MGRTNSIFKVCSDSENHPAGATLGKTKPSEHDSSNDGDLRWTSTPRNSDHKIKVLLYSQYTTLTGWGGPPDGKVPKPEASGGATAAAKPVSG